MCRGGKTFFPRLCFFYGSCSNLVRPDLIEHPGSFLDSRLRGMTFSKLCDYRGVSFLTRDSKLETRNCHLTNVTSSSRGALSRSNLLMGDAGSG